MPNTSDPETSQLTEREASSVNREGKHYLNALIKRLRAPTSADLDAIVSLPPKSKAYIAQSPEFQDYLLALALDAALGYERMTRGQWKALSWFKLNASRRAKDVAPKPYGILDVQPQEADVA